MQPAQRLQAALDFRPALLIRGQAALRLRAIEQPDINVIARNMPAARMSGRRII
jgi:hypothetical protein